MFNSTVRKSAETHAFIRVASRLLPVVLALAAAQLAHPQSQPIATILQGQLLTTKGVPVANATVQWSFVGSNPGQTGVSDSAGNFAFEIPLPYPTQVQLGTNANLYTPTQTTVNLQPGITSQVQVTLTSRPAGQSGSVHGTVRNSAGLVIPNATVSILGAGDFLHTTTDATGKFLFKPVGFNSNLTLQASTANAPCIATTQVPFAMSSASTVVSVRAPGVLSITSNCPPTPTPPGGLAAHGMRPLANDDSVQWQQADSLSIQNNGVPNAWNAGHVNDIVRLPPGQGLLVASDEGGVWTIAEDSSRTAVPLSDKWTSITASALALGTGGPADVYAGTFQYGDSEGGDLWETDTSQSNPLNPWLLQVSPKPPCSSIYRMLVIAESDTILLACDSGLWWSPIPPPPSVKGVYTWAQAQPAAIGGKAFSGLAKGPGWGPGGLTGTIVASRFGGSAPSQIIFTAKWKAGKLVLTASTVSIASTKLSRTSVAACASNPEIMYAAASDMNGQATGGVFQSSNGGVNWSPVTLPPSPGSFGDSNQAIAVSPDCSTVALGWETGTFVSFTGGGSWNLLTDSGNYNNLHIGIHALAFDPVLPATLFIGSDGGVASAAGLTSGSTPTFESDWNRELFNLEFFVGAASASVAGLVAGASQDNGVLYAGLPGPWLHVNDCAGLCPKEPGELALFATPISIGPGNDLLVDATVTAPIGSEGQYVESTGGVIPFNAQTGIPVIPYCSLCVIIVAAPVRFPGGFVNGLGQKMIAVGNIGPSDWTYGGVYGLFADDEGGVVHWELLDGGGMYGWGAVAAIAPTYDGSSIFISSGGDLFRLDAPFTSPAVLLAPEYCCEVNAIYAFNKNLAFAVSGFSGFSASAHFMSWNGTSWKLAGEATLPHDRPFLSIAALDTGRMYIASSAGVFDTSDGGNTWSTASTGLPTLIPGEGPIDFNIVSTTHDYLQLVTEPSGDTRLYLASYGRSLWRTYYPLPPPPAQRAMTSVQITIQTGNDNAETYTELQAKIGSAVSICLKPADTGDPSPGGVCPNGSGATAWANGATVTQTFSLSPPLVLDNSSIEIDLFEHNSIPNGSDNWDIQGITVTGFDSQGPLNLLQISVPLNGDNCMARLKASPNPSSVTYALSSNDPSGVNQTHPVPNFGATPPGSCPQ